VAQLKAELKRAALSSLYRQAQKTSTALADALANFQDANWQQLKRGKLVIASTGAGDSVTYSIPQVWQSFTQDEFLCLTQELIEVYSSALVTLSAQGNSSPSDDDIFATMLADDRLQSVTSLYHDHSLGRWPGRM